MNVGDHQEDDRVTFRLTTGQVILVGLRRRSERMPLSQGRAPKDPRRMAVGDLITKHPGRRTCNGRVPPDDEIPF